MDFTFKKFWSGQKFYHKNSGISFVLVADIHAKRWLVLYSNTFETARANWGCSFEDSGDTKETGGVSMFALFGNDSAWLAPIIQLRGNEWYLKQKDRSLEIRLRSDDSVVRTLYPPDDWGTDWGWKVISEGNGVTFNNFISGETLTYKFS